MRVTRSLEIPSRELVFRFSRSGGPGGQNVNRRETRVELWFDVASSPSLGPRQRARIMDRLRHRLDRAGRLRIVASQARTQAANRDLATERLRSLLADALRSETPRRPTRPSAGATQRRLATKRRRSAIKRSRAWEPED